MNKNDYTVKLAQPVCTTLKPYCSDIVRLEKISEKTTIWADKLLRLMLALGEVQCMLDGKFFDGKIELENLYKDLTSNLSRSKSKNLFDNFKCFQEKALECFEFFIKEKRGGANLCFEPECKCTGRVSSFINLKELGLFPLNILKEDSFAEDEIDLKYSIYAQARAKIKAFVKQRANYEKNKTGWSNVIAHSKLEHLEEITDLFDEINNADTRKEFTPNSLKRFLERNWIDREIGRKTKKVVQGIRSKLLEVHKEWGINYTFSNKDIQRMGGYGPQTLNAIYKHTNLWLNEDVLGRKDYNDLIVGSYHFQKEYISISSSARNGGRCLFRMGQNFDKYDLSLDNGVLTFVAKRYGIIFRSNIRSNGYLRNLAIVNSDEKECRYCIEYYTDSKCKTKWRGLVREPSVRMYANGDIKLFLIISCVHKANDPLFTANAEPMKEGCQCTNKFVCAYAKDCDGAWKEKNAERCSKKKAQDLFNIRNYLASAPDPTMKEKHSPPKGSYIAAAVDVGINNPIVVAIGEVCMDPTAPYGVKIKGSPKIVKYNMPDGRGGKTDFLNDLLITTGCLNKLTTSTARAVLDKDYDIQRDFYIDYFQRNYNWSEIFGVDRNGPLFTSNAEPMKKGCQCTNGSICAYAKNCDGEWKEKNAERCSMKKAQDFYDDYIKEVKCLPDNITEERYNVVRLWANKKVEWRVKGIFSSVRHKIASFRNEYINIAKTKNSCVKGSKEYLEAKSKIKTDASIVTEDFLKLSIITNHFSLQKKFSGNGIGVDKNLRRFHDGLRRRVDKGRASQVMNIASNHNALVLFVEGLECNGSASKDPQDNILRSLMGVGGMKKALTELGHKHGILIVPVDPHLTSQVNYETKKIGHRAGRYLYMSKEEKVHADENAAKNILWRGACRHADMIEFPVDQIGENLYSLKFKLDKYKKHNADDEIVESFNEENSETDLKGYVGFKKRKFRAAKYYFPNNAVIFRRLPNGTMDVKTPLTGKELNMKAIKTNKDGTRKKQSYVILDGNAWKLRHELDFELKKLSPYPKDPENVE